MLGQVRNYVLPAMQKLGPVMAWVVDETSFVKNALIRWSSTAILAVGQKENAVAVSLSVATATGPADRWRCI